MGKRLRTGVRDTPSKSATASSVTRCPGANSPLTIISRIRCMSGVAANEGVSSDSAGRLRDLATPRSFLLAVEFRLEKYDHRHGSMVTHRRRGTAARLSRQRMPPGLSAFPWCYWPDCYVTKTFGRMSPRNWKKSRSRASINMRGALGPRVNELHRFYHVPASNTAVKQSRQRQPKAPSPLHPGPI